MCNSLILFWKTNTVFSVYQPFKAITRLSDYCSWLLIMWGRISSNPDDVNILNLSKYFSPVFSTLWPTLLFQCLILSHSQHFFVVIIYFTSLAFLFLFCMEKYYFYSSNLFLIAFISFVTCYSFLFICALCCSTSLGYVLLLSLFAQALFDILVTEDLCIAGS